MIDRFVTVIVQVCETSLRLSLAVKNIAEEPFILSTGSKLAIFDRPRF